MVRIINKISRMLSIKDKPDRLVGCIQIHHVRDLDSALPVRNTKRILGFHVNEMDSLKRAQINMCLDRYFSGLSLLPVLHDISGN